MVTFEEAGVYLNEPGSDVPIIDEDGGTGRYYDGKGDARKMAQAWRLLAGLHV